MLFLARTLVQSTTEKKNEAQNMKKSHWMCSRIYIYIQKQMAVFFISFFLFLDNEYYLLLNHQCMNWIFFYIFMRKVAHYQHWWGMTISMFDVNQLADWDKKKRWMIWLLSPAKKILFLSFFLFHVGQARNGISEQ